MLQPICIGCSIPQEYNVVFGGTNQKDLTKLKTKVEQDWNGTQLQPGFWAQ